MEPGENPGRSGHCECGVFFMRALPSVIGDSREDEKRGDAESGYLLCEFASSRALYCFERRQNVFSFCRRFDVLTCA